MAAKNFEISNGTFKMLFSNGDLRKLRAGNDELIQRIYFAVRDEEWLNVPYTIRNLSKQTTGESVSLSYEMFFSREEIKFSADIKILIDADYIIIEANGKALTSFKKNRIGLCLHLPAALKGTDCIITHNNNNQTSSSFPFLISPHQPFKNIIAIEWAKNGQKVSITFEGDVFEMEDQRNWTDASYKIYSTPLEIPFPVAVKEGEDFYQKTSIKLSGTKLFEEKDINKEDKTFLMGAVPSPAFGIAEPAESDAGDKHLSENISLPFSHYKVDFFLNNKSWKNTSLQGIERASSLHLPIYAVVYFGGNFILQAEEFTAFIHSLKNISIHSICLLSYKSFVLADNALQSISSVMRYSFPGLQIGAGTDANFAQLNRNRPNSHMLDFVCYSIQPQEHASDALSIIENIQGQADTVQTAKTFSYEKQIHISALSFFKRFNANLNFISDNEIVNYEYKGSNFEAAWFVASLHQLIVAGASCINCVYPLKEELPLVKFFNYLAKNQPEYYYTCGSSSPEKYAMLSWQTNNKRHSVFANLTEETIEVAHPYATITLKPSEIYYMDSI